MIDTTEAWRALEAHRAATSELTLRRLFDDEPNRAVELTIDVDGLLADLSKHLVTGETLDLLIEFLADGSLPPGLSLSPSTGNVSGVPTSLGQWIFAVQVTDEDDDIEVIKVRARVSFTERFTTSVGLA